MWGDSHSLSVSGVETLGSGDTEVSCHHNVVINCRHDMMWLSFLIDFGMSFKK